VNALKSAFTSTVRASGRSRSATSRSVAGACWRYWLSR
jgi:hypothetical protein